MADLVLYKFDACPYCQYVLQYVAKRGLRIPTRDTRADPGARDELERIGGMTQVPCLVIDGQALYESRDIVAWLEQNVPDSAAS